MGAGASTGAASPASADEIAASVSLLSAPQITAAFEALPADEKVKVQGAVGDIFKEENARLKLELLGTASLDDRFEGSALLEPLDKEQDGPLGLPFPTSLYAEIGGKYLTPKEVVQHAHEDWSFADGRIDPRRGSTLKGKRAAWSRASTLAYLIFAIKMAHRDERFKRCGLRLIARCYGYFERESPMLVPIHATAQGMMDQLSLVLLEYRRAHRLAEKLEQIAIASNKSKLSLKDYMPFFAEEKRAAVTAVSWGNGPSKGVYGSEDIDYDVGLTCSLILMVHYVGDGYFDTLKELFTGVERSRFKPAPHKTYSRFYSKAMALGGDYADTDKYPDPKTQHIKDALRASVISEDAAAQLQVWERLQTCEQLEILSVKNTFAFSDEEASRETGGMMQILINVLYKPQKKGGGGPLTYGDILADADGLQAICKIARVHNPLDFVKHWDIFGKVCEQVLADPSLAAQPVQLLAEVQLHLDYFVLQRKKTHLWFKIVRANTLNGLWFDCEDAYRDMACDETKDKTERSW